MYAQAKKEKASESKTERWRELRVGTRVTGEGKTEGAASQACSEVRAANPHIYIPLINPDYHFLITLLGLP